jgi:hypothetical protein
MGALRHGLSVASETGATALLEVHQLNVDAPAVVMFYGPQGFRDARDAAGSWLDSPLLVQVTLHLPTADMPGEWHPVGTRVSPYLGGSPRGTL